jgi:hypothetical protein
MPTYCHIDSTDVIENDYKYFKLSAGIVSKKMTIKLELHRIFQN